MTDATILLDDFVAKSIASKQRRADAERELHEKKAELLNDICRQLDDIGDTGECSKHFLVHAY